VWRNRSRTATLEAARIVLPAPPVAVVAVAVVVVGSGIVI
jgi:hypothetical protein